MRIEQCYYNHIDNELGNQLQEIIENRGEFEQLESAIYLLDGLIGWCALCFNNEQEEKDYKKLCQAYNILMEVHKNYENY